MAETKETGWGEGNSGMLEVKRVVKELVSEMITCLAFEGKDDGLVMRRVMCLWW